MGLFHKAEWTRLMVTNVVLSCSNSQDVTSKLNYISMLRNVDVFE